MEEAPMRIKLREVRERLLVTQDELAERTGISRATLSRLENGLQRPRISTVRKLAAALGVDASELIDWTAEESGEQGKAAA
jgi:transcriptional regulator with XRE-family HTH domain